MWIRHKQWLLMVLFFIYLTFKLLFPNFDQQENISQAIGPISSDLDITCHDVSQSEACSAMDDTIDVGVDEYDRCWDTWIE